MISAGPTSGVARNVDAVRRRIEAAATRAGRNPADIQLIAVSKTFGEEFVRAGEACGLRSFGENRIQEALPKIHALADLGIEWHLIGHLQSNKVKRAAAAFAWIQSIDSQDLLRRVNDAARELQTKPRILIQVDLAKESTKHGIDEHDLLGLARAALEATFLDLRGLMIVPPIPEHPEDSRPWFQKLVAVRDRLVAAGIPRDRLSELSMGMSHDFEVAIAEGATMVRVGTAIFGRRAPQPRE